MPPVRETLAIRYLFSIGQRFFSAIYPVSGAAGTAHQAFTGMARTAVGKSLDKAANLPQNRE
jgi:hypothetical protein